MKSREAIFIMNKESTRIWKPLLSILFAWGFLGTSVALAAPCINTLTSFIGIYGTNGKIYHMNISGDNLKVFYSDES